MVDKFNAIGLSGSIRPGALMNQKSSANQMADGKDFKSLLMDSINEVNRLQAMRIMPELAWQLEKRKM